MNGQCTPSRNKITAEYSPVDWNIYKRYLTDDDILIKYIDYHRRVIILQTLDSDLVAWLSDLGRIHFNDKYTMFLCHRDVLFDNPISCLKHYDPSESSEPVHILHFATIAAQGVS